MKKLPEELKNAEMGVVTVECGDHNEVHLHVGKGAKENVKKAGQKALKEGKQVKWADGTRQWHSDEMVVNPDPNLTGSQRYTWDKTGNRCKHIRYLYTKTPDGKISKEKVRVVWKSY